jgi:hypothetical protein
VQVVALWQGLVRVEGHDWPTNRKPLAAPELKKERTIEKDQLRRTTLRPMMMYLSTMKC